jgi:hypothetical protein
VIEERKELVEVGLLACDEALLNWGPRGSTAARRAKCVGIDETLSVSSFAQTISILPTQ